MAFDAAAFDAVHNVPPNTAPDAGEPSEHGPTSTALTDDPIVAEVRAIRETLFAEAGYDLEEFGRQIRASEAAEGLTSVTWPRRAP